MISNLLTNITKANTSTINFCEHDNYNNYFYEIYNTFSSLTFTFFGIYGLFKYKKRIDYSIRMQNILYIMLIFVGLLSAYFHAVLSEFSHVMDIISISMILSTSMYNLKMIKKNNQQNYFEIGFEYGIEMMLYVFLAFTMPILHIIMEFYYGYTLHNLIENMINNFKLNNTENNIIKFHKLKETFYNCKFYFVLSICFWILDSFLCELLFGYHFHWIFHILISYVAYQLISIIETFCENEIQ